MGSATDLVYKLVALVVLIIIATTVLVPVVNDATTDLTITKQNTSQLYAMSSDPADSISIVYTSATDIKVNGYQVPTDSNSRKLLAICDDFTVLWFSGLSGIFVNSANGVHLTSSVTIASGTVSYVVEDNPVSFTYNSTVLYAAAHGSYGEYQKDSEFFINSDTVMYTVIDDTFTNADLTPNSVSVSAVMKGTYNSMAATAINGSPTATIGMAVNSTDMGGYLKITVSDTQYTYTDSNGTYSVTTARPFIAPISYTTPATSMITLLNIIPILVFVAAIVMGATLLRGRS